ncbi:dihydropteroate synthase [Planctomycetota bacterium]|nr:dihydropteroate synthase [Planctomycetota bacterium]
MSLKFPEPKQLTVPGPSGDSSFHTLQTPAIMAVLNVTPDSFSDGGQFCDTATAIQQGIQLVRDGADILDIGGESTRPGAEPVDVGTELERTVPVIKGLRENGVTVPISIDTMKVEVARQTVAAGANIVNDVTAGTHDSEMLTTCAELGCTVVLMHMRGSPQNMQHEPNYDDFMGEVTGYLSSRIQAANEAGIQRERVWIDPGFGFGKLPQHNCEMIRRLEEFTKLAPVLIGVSRKSTLGRITGAEVNDREAETLTASVLSAFNRAAVIRVHEPKPLYRALQVIRAMA